MEKQDLEKRTYSLAGRYKAAYKELKRDRPVPAQVLKRGMIISGIGAAVAGALLAYQLSDTVESIIEYFLQQPF